MRRLALLVLAAIAAMGQNTAKFPGATVTLQDLLVAKDAPSRSYLTAGIDAATLSIPLADGTRFTTFQVITAADTGEQILVCSIASNTLNVCPGGRGFSGTAAAAHGIGTGMIANVVAWHHNQLAAEIKAIEEALGPNLSNVTATTSWDTLTGKPTTFVFSDQSYTDPAWLTLTKAKVGLGSVENTALSTWAGSANITALGTIASGTVPWARLSSVPTNFWPSPHSHPIGDLSTVGDYSSKITSGTYAINISGTAANATTLGTLGLQAATGAPAANQILRSDANGYANFGWINTTSGDAGAGAITRVYASTDAYIRYYTPANFTKQMANALVHDASFTWVDPYVALPTGVVMYGVFTPRAAQATITSVWCWSDTTDAVIQLRRSDGGDMISGNLACNGGQSTTAINGYGALPVNYTVGVWQVSGTAKQIRVGLTYTTAY